MPAQRAPGLPHTSRCRFAGTGSSGRRGPLVFFDFSRRSIRQNGVRAGALVHEATRGKIAACAMLKPRASERMMAQPISGQSRRRIAAKKAHGAMS